MRRSMINAKIERVKSFLTYVDSQFPLSTNPDYS